MTIEKEAYVFPMSFAQQRLWFLDQFEPGKSFYNIPANARLSGSLNLEVLNQSINEIIRRHEILRTTFTMMGGKPVQVIAPALTVALPQVDLRHFSENEQALRIRQFACEEIRRPFHLAEGPLLRGYVLLTGEAEHVLILTMHHIIFDAWSMPVFIREMAAIYSAFSAGEPSPLAELSIQYADFALWQREWLNGETSKSELNYWKEHLTGAPPVMTLPASRVRPSTRSSEAGSVNLIIDRELTQRLNELSRKEGATLFMTILAAFSVLLFRYNGQENIVVGSPIANRNQAEIESLIGFFVNTLALRLDISGNPSFRKLLARVRDVALDAYSHQDVPFEQVVECLQPERNMNITPLFQVLFALQNAPVEELKLPGLTLSSLTEFETETARFDLELYLWDVPEEGIHGKFVYKKDIFEFAVIERMAGHLKTLIEGITLNPDRKISELPLLTKAEEHQLLVEWNDTCAEYPQDKCIHQIFEAQAKQTPDAIAVVFEDQSITYKELNVRANRLAHCLRDIGIRPEMVVGICMERSLEMIVGIIGILKAGGAYMPLDPIYPEDRLTFILEDSQPSVVITRSSILNLQSSVLCLDRDREMISRYDEVNPVNGTTPDNLAYVIYTSGSTGKPKAVMIEHKNVHNLILGLEERIYRRYEKKLNVALVSPYVFDASVQQIFGALLQGHSLYTVPEYTRMDGSSLLEFYHTHKIDISDGTPSHIRMLLESSGENTLPLDMIHFIIGGEALPQNTTGKFLRKFPNFAPVITNVYGVAECCVDSICYDVSTEAIDLFDTIPIGRPMQNVKVYIVDNEYNLQPVGIPGELCISGDGVGRGYLKRKELTSTKFVASPFRKGERLYRTGDLARWRVDGNIEFLGRMDRQVKIRGFRIELEEVEAALRNYKKQSDSKAVLSDDRAKITDNEVVAGCIRCLLPSNYPDIHFDGKGVCNICRKYEEYEEYAKGYFKKMDDFCRLIEKARKTCVGAYDCLLLYSGGKDSSYVLYRLVDMGLKVLTFTFDNGYISDTAFENIKRITSNLNVDNIICKTNNMPEIFLESLEFDQTVCTGCFKALTTISTRIAYEKGINVIITGLSRGQIFDTKLHTLFNQSIFDTKKIEEKLLLFRKMYHARNDRVSRLLDIDLPDDLFESLHFVDFFRYDDITVCKIKEYLRIKDKCWSQPEDTGFCSTNCIINDVGIYVHLNNKGYHNYAAPLSWDIRLGKNTREEGLHELFFEADRLRIHKILNELGYFTIRIKDVIVLNKKDAEGNAYLCAYFVSKQEISVSELREYLSKKLPDYIIPGRFMRIEKLPLTPNGKVDWKALPEPEMNRPELGKTLVPPRTPAEKTVAAIWLDVLRLENVGIHDDFFELGGHSLMATQVVSRIRQTFHIEMPLRILFEKPTIAEVAEWLIADQLEQAEEETLESIIAEVDGFSDDEVKSLLQTKEPDG
jgi:amino acid adenylation domain-containing protein